MTLPKLPIGVQDFPSLIEGGFLYVDKTKDLHSMVTNGRVYFLPRPRRFGKSLLLSTIESIFKCKKALFKGLWIAQSDYDWPEHPVVRIDMSKTDRNSVETFSASLIEVMQETAKDYKINLPSDGSPAMVLNRLINLLDEKHGKVVVLIDEYDKPILDNIKRMGTAYQIRDELRNFYTILKAQDGKIKFIMLTGITKFSKVSIFSGLNNLQDISLSNKYASILGYTQAEIEHTFKPWVQRLADKLDTTIEEQFKQIKKWYNGYIFSGEGEPVYNPFSTLLLLEQQEYRNFWYATGTPTFLLELIKLRNFAPEEVDQLQVTEDSLINEDIDNLSLIGIFFQAGYLTIKSYDRTYASYELNYPNLEVKSAFTKSLLAFFTEADKPQQDSTTIMMIKAINARDFETLFTQMKRLLANIPYQFHKPDEAYYHSLFYLIFRMLGYRMSAEVHTNIGRIDAIIELDDQVLIFELKLNKSAKAALKQIHEKKYYEPYQNSGKTIQLFGINFDMKERNITKYLHETL